MMTEINIFRDLEDHPNIVSIKGGPVNWNGQYAIMCEFLDGGSLEDALNDLHDRSDYEVRFSANLPPAAVAVLVFKKNI